MRELFANTTLYETLKKFDDIPFIIYHDYAKDNFFELKNAHPILLDSNLSKNWYQHYKNLQQNFFFTENDIILFTPLFQYNMLTLMSSQVLSFLGDFVQKLVLIKYVISILSLS